MSEQFLAFLRKRPNSFKIIHLPQHKETRQELLCDLLAILHWLSPPYELDQDVDCLETSLILFIQGLRHVSIEPVFYIASPIGCSKDNFNLLISHYQDDHIKKLSIYNDSARCQYDNLSINPLLVHHVRFVLSEMKVKYYQCLGNDISLVYKYSLQEQVVGILSNDSHFALMDRCVLIPLGCFDKSMRLKYNFVINPTPSEIVCQYTSLELIMDDLLARTKDNLIDAIILCGNIYTQYLNSHYKIPEYLEIKSKDYKPYLDYVAKCDSYNLFGEGKLLFLCDTVPQYRMSIDSSYNLFDCKLSPAVTTCNTISYWVKKRIENGNHLSAVLFSLTNSNIYWRDPLFESMSLGRLSIHDLLLPVRSLLYELLGSHKVVEYGSTSTRSFAETIVTLSDTDEEDDVVQRLLDIQQLSLRQKLSLLFKYVVHKRLIIDERLLESAIWESVSEDEDVLVKYSIWALSLWLYGSILSQSKNEFNGLIEYVLSVAAGLDVTVSSDDDRLNERSMTVMVWYSHTLQIIYYFLEVLGLNGNIPRPFDLFLPLSAGKIINRHLGAVDDTNNILSLPLVKLFHSSCSGGCNQNSLNLIKLFKDAVDSVKNQSPNQPSTATPTAVTMATKVATATTVAMATKVATATTVNTATTTTNDHLLPQPSAVHGVNTINDSDDHLSILDYRADILVAIRDHRVTTIIGEPGCGKSTKVPQYILDDCSGTCNVLVAQPRCVGATSLAKRVSEELGERCGQTVGYIIGGHRCVSKETKLVYCTSGYLLQKLVYHPLQIRQYTHLILDEVHERTADADFVMLLVRKLVMELSPLTKIILMSATLQGKLFVNYFREMFDKENVPDPIFVGLKRFEVKEYFLDQIKDVLDDSTQSNHQLAAKSYLESLCGLKVFSQLIESFNPSVKPSITLTSQEVCSELIIHYSVLGQSILVFLPGLSDIMDYYDILSDVLKRRKIDHLFKLFVLHSQVPIEEQHLILKSPPLDVVHVILSTNIAETALTIPQLAVIINFGICRLPKYDHKRQMMQLVTSWCSKSSCSQRAGRVGRLFEGTAIHLFPKSFHQHVLPDFNPPEMHTTPLGKLLLRARQIGEELNISSPSELLKLVVEPPSLLQLEHALQELLFIGAIVTTDCTKVTEDSDITLLGKFSLALSIDLELCRLVFYSLCFGCPVEGIIMAAAISHHQDVFTMPSRVLINSTESYLQSLKNSLRTRFEYDDGIYSDLIVICRLYQSLLQFCIDNSLKFTKGLNKFCTFQSTSYQRLHSLVCIISSLADSVLNFVDKSNSSYNKIHLLTQVTTSSDMEEFHDTELFCNNEGIMQSVIMAAFIRNVVFGKRKIESDIAGERKKACIGRDVIDRFKFKPGKSLVSNCNRKLTTGDLEKIVKYVCPNSSCKVIIDGFMCAVEVTDLYCEGFDVPLLWQFGERRGSKMDDGTPYPYFFSPYELVWNRIHGNHERLNLFSWRNKTGFVCELSEAPPTRMGVVSVIQGSESTEFVRGKYLTLFPSLTTSRLSVLLLLAFQPFHMPVQLRNNGKCVTAMKIDQFEIDFEKWQVLTVEDVMIINKLRRALSKVVGCTDKHSCLPWGQLVDIQKFLSLMIDESAAAGDRKHSINDESSGGGGLFESEVISCELYPRYTSSLLTMNEIRHNGEDKERKISSGKHVRFSTTTTTTPLDGPAPSVVPVTPPAVPPLAPSVVPVTPPAVPPLAPSVVPVTPPAIPPLAPSVVPVTPPAIPPLAPSAVSPWLSQQTTTTHQLSVYQLPLLRNPPVSMSPPQVTNHPPISNHPRVTLLGYPPGFRPSSPLTTPPRPFVPHLPSSCVPLNGGTIVPSPIGPIELTIIKTLMARNYTMPFKELMNNKCIVQCFVQYKVPLNLDFFRMRNHLFDVDNNFNVTIK